MATVEGTLQSTARPLTEEEHDTKFNRFADVRRLPIVGELPLPMALRPDCVNCGAKLKPQIEAKMEPRGEGSKSGAKYFYSHRVFTGIYGYDRHGYFCNGNCAKRFATAAAAAGYRRRMPLARA